MTIPRFYQDMTFDKLWSGHRILNAKTEDFSISLAAGFDSGEEGGSEVVAAQDGLLYVTNGAQDKIDILDAATGAFLDDVPLASLPGYAGLQSVAVSGDRIAVAIETETDFEVPGWIVFYDLAGNLLEPVEVGNLPDMVTFSKDGTMAFSANEGEPNDSGDPAGSISVIDLSDYSVQTIGFDGVAIPEDVRVFPGNDPLLDLEPEYIAESGGKLFVTLQEAASVGVFDLATMAWETIIPLGTQDHSVVPLDANDDGLVDLQTYENLVGMRMPDAIAATEIDGTTYFLTANEGDDRGDFDEPELGDLGDAARVGDILDGDVFVDGVQLSFADGVDTTGLERLKISTIDGVNESGEIETMHAYGSRSFTIFEEDGTLVFDSGAQFEQILSVFAPERFNNDDGEILGELDDDGDPIVDNRSDAKGPEPEAIEIGQIGDTTLAFIGLERTGEIMIYDISDPENSKFVDFIDGRALGQESPEIIEFIPAEDSATGEAQIAVSYEVSGTTAVFDLPFGEKLRGTFGDDSLTGSIGEDRISGGWGDDALSGGGGDDKIRGSWGDDTIEGGFGDDRMSGGWGSDVFVFNFFSGNDKIKDLRSDDLIDLSATGLEFGDLSITQTGRKEFLVEYGDFGDTIEVDMAGYRHDQLTEDSFLF